METWFWGLKYGFNESKLDHDKQVNYTKLADKNIFLMHLAQQMTSVSSLKTYLEISSALIKNS